MAEVSTRSLLGHGRHFQRRIESHTRTMPVAAITRSIQDAKSIPSLILQLCKFFIRVDPRYYIRCIIASKCLTCRLKTLSNLRFGKKYDKNATASEPRRGINSLYLLNQAIIVRVLGSWILPVFDNFIRFFSNLLKKLHNELNGKSILKGN
jgi:hypothetical protein